VVVPGHAGVFGVPANVDDLGKTIQLKWSSAFWEMGWDLIKADLFERKKTKLLKWSPKFQETEWLYLNWRRNAIY
jgi:hypothetical protein